VRGSIPRTNSSPKCEPLAGALAIPEAMIPGLREKPLAELDLYHRDITPNLNELM